MELLNKLKRLKKPKAPWKKYYPGGQDTIKVPKESLYDYFEKKSMEHLDAPAYEYYGTTKTYRELLDEIDHVAKAYKSIGVRQGDVVTILMPNTPESIVSFFALNKIGAISNMVHPLSSQEEIKYYINSTKSVVLLTIDMCYDKIKNIVEETDLYKIIYVSVKESMPLFLRWGYQLIKGRKVLKPKNDIEYMPWKDFIKKADTYRGRYVVHSEDKDIAVILHSGGTTGKPKGIAIRNQSFTAVIEQARIVMPDIGVGDSTLAILPIFHGFGLQICVYKPLCFGEKAIIRPTFDAKKFDKLLIKTNPTTLLGVPTLFEALTNTHNKKLDLSKLKWLIVGGDSLKPALEVKINDFIHDHGARIVVTQGYGMSESLGPTVFSYGDNNKSGCMGIPLSSNYVKIVVPGTHDEVKQGECGEICVTGPTLMAGYIDNEEENNKALQQHSDGYVWLHSGDMGYMDSDGVFFFRQRLKRMIISSGYNVYPDQIEEVIESHPAVLTCTVIGVPHKYKMEVPKAYIVLKNGHSASITIKQEIKELCKKNLSVFSIPKEFEFRKSLPNTLLGKVDYTKLKNENKKND